MSIDYYLIRTWHDAPPEHTIMFWQDVCSLPVAAPFLHTCPLKSSIEYRSEIIFIPSIPNHSGTGIKHNGLVPRILLGYKL